MPQVHQNVGLAIAHLADQDETEELFDPSEPFARSREAADTARCKRKRDVGEAEPNRQGEKEHEAEERALAALNHQEQSQHDRYDAFNCDSPQL